ncbi:(2Fe-2S)-binding protein [Ottowia sp.]|uniref:(2Fe-2S)-binding protein n=1 Tax=Ottowia sp. TaxID=1898956 RepID=UPI001E1912DC|nr:(2Fe-2S)-binding protein [Ottowia sp.]MCB2034039.1 (2Fe-2S)-binding protein [Ottowia sp.]MCP5257002.1 (2Fe-2S)-binding protein [Burkholderiaceae bacterium]HRW71653.1 (2Fe-2S)-binding protein [Ottowia sp.]
MIVCVCNRVSDRDIARHAHAGMGFDDIQLELGVATCCGRCEDCARELVEQCSATHPVAALHRADVASPRGEAGRLVFGIAAI